MSEFEKLLEQVKEYLPSEKIITAAKLQRKFRITYPTACHVLHDLQNENLVSSVDQMAGYYSVMVDNLKKLAADGAKWTCSNCGATMLEPQSYCLGCDPFCLGSICIPPGRN